MIYPAVTLINRTKKMVEWTVGGARFEMKVDEVRSFNSQDDRFAAHHALKFTNTGLEVLTDEIEEEEATRAKKVMPDYSKMKWQELVKKVGKDFKPGMMKEQAVEVLENRWKKRNRKWLKEGK